VLAPAVPAVAETPPPAAESALAAAEVSPAVAESATTRPGGALSAVASDADQAMEYWDVTAWLDTGERVLARFLVTNQGPGRRTAAAVGHVALADGTVLPFRWGRRAGAWTLAADGRRLEIGKAVLDLTGPTILMTVRSKKRGLDLRLAIEGSAGRAATHDLGAVYATEVVLPSPARAELAARGAATRTAEGAAALTHTWMERPESELLGRRDELFARGGGVSLYLSLRTRGDGAPAPDLVVRRGGHTTARRAPSMLDVALSADGDGPYPVARTWHVTTAGIDVRAVLERELLRMDPLEILPQPFRFILSLGGRPQRVWADARVTVDLAAEGDAPAVEAELRGVATTAFSRSARASARPGNHPSSR
jgi:hypothetical protein